MKIVRSKDLPLTPEQTASRQRRADVKQVDALRTRFAGKKFSEVRAGDRDELFRAIATHLGFVLPE